MQIVVANRMIDSKFGVGERVYLITDQDQLPYIVTGIMIRDNYLEYAIANGATPEIFCQAMELTKEKDYTKC